MKTSKHVCTLYNAGTLNKLTPQSRDLGKFIVTHLVWKLPHIMEPEDSLTCS